MDSSSHIRSRKRTRSSSKCDELSGTFTRSKSQIYLHRNRFGYARPDSTCDRFIKGPATTRADLLPKDVRLDVKVKDLRARRVFSPDTSVINNVDGGFGDGGDVSKGGESGGGDVIKVDGGGGGGVGLICDDDVSKEGEVDVCKKIDGGDADVSKGGEVGDYVVR
nr:hypothetical protein [Tanacetum cinerariifolium]